MNTNWTTVRFLTFLTPHILPDKGAVEANCRKVKNKWERRQFAVWSFFLSHPMWHYQADYPRLCVGYGAHNGSLPTPPLSHLKSATSYQTGCIFFHKSTMKQIFLIYKKHVSNVDPPPFGSLSPHPSHLHCVSFRSILWAYFEKWAQKQFTEEIQYSY